jgi:hypothetical protein
VSWASTGWGHRRCPALCVTQLRVGSLKGLGRDHLCRALQFLEPLLADPSLPNNGPDLWGDVLRCYRALGRSEEGVARFMSLLAELDPADST